MFILNSPNNVLDVCQSLIGLRVPDSLAHEACLCCKPEHAEKQLPARREQRGCAAGGGEADEAEGAGDTALLQGDAGQCCRAQPTLAGEEHKPDVSLLDPRRVLPAGPQGSLTLLFLTPAASYVPRQQHRQRRRPLEGIPEEKCFERVAGQTDERPAEGGAGPG